MFDEQFSAVPNETSDEGDISYALNPIDKGGEPASTHFAYYFSSTELFYFTFMRRGSSTNLYTGVVTDAGIMANNYDTILRKVKRKCKYIKIYTVSKTDYACYECKDAEFKGYLGFAIVNGLGTISNFNYID